MAILQAIISLISRSASTILNAVFGWAVIALFGRTSKTQYTLLSGVVAMAAAWPLLLFGTAFPKLAAFLVSFVPAVSRAPTWAVRTVWIVLAVAVPVIVGLVVASKAPPGSPAEPFVKRVLRGVPITIALAGAFLLMFVTVPILRLISAVKGRTDEHVPLVTEGPDYAVVAAQIDGVLERRSIEAHRGEPAWWMSAPTTLLKKLGGRAFRGFLPERPAFWRGPGLEVALYPSDLLIRGANTKSAWTHGLLAEALAHGPGLQTVDPDAQRLEKQIRRVWAVYDENPAAHVRSRALLSRLDEIAAGCATLQVPYDEWQVVYRQVCQLGRALAGERQIIEGVDAPKDAPKESVMHVDPIYGEGDPIQRIAQERPLATARTRDLAADLASESSLLVKKEVELAKAEIRADLAAVVRMAKGIGVAAVFGIVVLNLLFVAAALSWAGWLDPWVCVLIAAAFAAVIAAVAGLVGWSSRVRKPFERTLRTLEEDVQWVKERFA